MGSDKGRKGVPGNATGQGPVKYDKKNPAPKTFKRRDFLSWLGNATALALGSRVLLACDMESGVGHGDAGGDGGVDAGPGGDSGIVLPDGQMDADYPGWDGGGEVCEDFPFEPGTVEDEIYQTWGIRTVDYQNVGNLLQNWRLTVDGLVENPLVFSFADLLCLERQDQITDFHCVEGWSVLDVPWNGVHFSKLAALVKPLSSATHVTVYCSRGIYTESMPLDVVMEPKTLLGYGIDEKTLPLSHGFPLRFVVPRLYAYKSAKYVERLELADGPVNGYWENRGFTYDAEVPTSRLRPGRY